MSDERKRPQLLVKDDSETTVSDVELSPAGKPEAMVNPAAEGATALPQEEDEEDAIVTLTVVEGPLQGKNFTYNGPATAIIGRSRDCSIRLPSDEEHKTISRHHCLLDIAPPEIRVRDFGSLNGTWVNGEKIGQRAQRTRDLAVFPEHDLKDGDKIKLGSTVFEVSIVGGAGSGGGRSFASPREFLNEWLSTLPKRQQFTVEKELGRGGMGAVFLVKDRADRPYAIKVLLPQCLVSKKHRQRFRRELTTLKRMKHENIVSLVDHFVFEGAYVLLLDYCNGGNLKEHLAHSGGTIGLTEALAIQGELLAALHHAHESGVVHRDLSPDNILFHEENGKRMVKLSDFGLAKACEQAGLSGLTRTGTVGGKPYYMPRSLVIDFKYAKAEADLWSATAVLYHSLTGCYPRDFAKDKDPWTVVLGGKVRPIKERSAEVPEELAKVIDDMLDEKNPSQLSAEEFRQTLSRFVPRLEQ